MPTSFHSRKIPADTNKTNVFLISKNKNPSNLKYFRPISLCNTTYKIIAKIIAQRLRLIMDKLIGPNEASILKNMQASDNAIVIKEIITHFKKMEGQKANLILEVDLEKAYDKME